VSRRFFSGDVRPESKRDNFTHGTGDFEDACDTPYSGHRFSFTCSPENQCVPSKKKRAETTRIVRPADVNHRLISKVFRLRMDATALRADRGCFGASEVSPNSGAAFHLSIARNSLYF
jgi:hypothetical protein